MFFKGKDAIALPNDLIELINRVKHDDETIEEFVLSAIRVLTADRIMRAE